MHWIRAALGLSFVALWIAGCGVMSKHPLTDETTSVVDERLIGAWEGVPEKGKDGKPKAEDLPRIYIGRHENMANTLEAVIVSVEEERVKVQRFHLFTTTLGEHRYVSAGKEDVYLIFLYELAKPDELTFYMMKDEVVKAAIEKGLLEGEVKKEKGTGFLEIEYETIRITASPEALAAWIKAYSPACYGMDEPKKLRRLVFEITSEASEQRGSPGPPPPPPPDEGG